MKEYIIEECKGKNIFVTGGAGFIGSEVTRQISYSGGNVLLYDNFSSGKRKYVLNYPRVRIIKGDIRNSSCLEKVIKKCEYVINLAALPFIPDSYHFPQEFFDINTNGTLNVVTEAIRSKKIKNFVHISTSEVYGTAKKIPMSEKHPTLPHSTYAVSKLAADRAVFTLHKEHGFPAVIIRPFNSYGPNITQPYIIPEIISQILLNSGKIKLGNIESERDFTYVSDTAHGIVLSLFSNKAIGQTINLGSQKAYKIKKIVELIGEIVDKKVEIIKDKERLRPYDVNKLVCDNHKAKSVLGWEPHVSFKVGLQKTIEWIKQNGLELRTPFEGWPKYYRNRHR